MSGDITRLVGALVGADLVAHHGRGKAVERPVVALSRSFGSGGEEVAHALAARLGVECYDHELLVRVAEDAQVDRFLMERLDEHVRGLANDWVFSILTGKSAYPEDYRRHLVNVVLGIMNSGGVMVGRGVNIILREHHAFRVRIVGSEDARVDRVVEAEGLNDEAARAKVRAVDKERAAFIRNTYHEELEDAAAFDLVINTDHLKPADAVEVILCAMRLGGFPVPKDVA